MSNQDEKVERELERERHARAQHDEARAGLARVEEEFRLKDARERADTCNLKRQAGR
jgi:hypothetical protein